MKILLTGAAGQLGTALQVSLRAHEVVALSRHLSITTPVQPVSTAEFPRPAERPGYSVLTTVQDPAIFLPPWEDGVAAFADAVRRSHSA